MEWFYFIVIVIAIVLLIVMLTFVGSKMVDDRNKGNSDTIFPPVKNTCPDLWEATENSSNDILCKVPTDPKKNVGLLTSNTKFTETPGNSTDDNNNQFIDFSDSGWETSGSAECAQKAWANNNNILWDGTSNYNSCN
jgi:hypothetical protein